MVYTRYIPGIYFHGKYLLHDKIYFPNKVFGFILLNFKLNGYTLLSVRLIYRILVSLSEPMHGDDFLKSYTVLSIAVVYDSHFS